MVERESPLGADYQPGLHGNVWDGAGVRLAELQPGSVVEVTAWPGRETEALAAIRAATGLSIGEEANSGALGDAHSAFGFAPRKWLLAGRDEGLTAVLEAAMTYETGSVTDLSHGRAAIRISGPRVEWVLSKLFALDFALEAFPIASGRATAHHEIFAQIQRTAADEFYFVIFRSFARSFWKPLCHLSEEVGYEVA